MPQDPYPKIRFGPVQQPGQTGRSLAEAQFEQAAYSQFLPQAQADPYQVESGMETAWKGVDPEAQKRLASLRAALESRIAKGKQEADVRITREGLKGPMERLQQGSPNFGAFMGGYLTPLAGGVDTVLDIGARIGDSLGRAAAGNGGPQGRFEYDYDPNDIFTPGPGLGTVAAPGSKVKYVGPELVQSGFLEAVAGGAKTPAEARQKFSQGFSGIDPNDMAKLRAQVAEDDKREEQGLPRVLSDEETKTILSAEDPGLPGMAGDTIAMLALTPGGAARGIGGAVSKALPGAASKGAAGVVNRAVGQAAGEGVAFGATRGITEQSADAGLHDAAFGAGMGGAGSAISSAVGSQAAQRLLAAQSALRGRVVRYLGRTAAETAKLRAGRVAASFLEGGETPSEALNADLAGELGPAALFAIGTGGSMARVEQRARANKAGKAMVRAGENQRNAQSAAKDLREAFDIANEIQAKDQAVRKQNKTVETVKSRLARDAAEKEYQARLEERTQGRLQELGQEIQKGLDNKSTRDFAEATAGLRERLRRMDEEVAAEQAKRAEDAALNRKIEQEGELRQLQARKKAAESAPSPETAADPQQTLRTLASLETAPRRAEAPARDGATAPLERSEIEWAKKVQAEVESTGRALTKPEQRKLLELGERYEANRPTADAPSIASSAKPESPAPAAVGGTAAPAKPGRKPRAITPAEGAWAAEAIQRKARGEKLTAAENKKLEALKARFDKTKAYEAAQRAEAQRQQEAASSPDPRARLSDKGKSMVDQYTAAIQKPMDAATYKATREQFIRKMKQSAKWNPEVGKATAEVRASEVQTLIDTLDREAPEQVKKFLLDEMQAGQEATLREALKNAKTPQEKSEIRAQIRALKRKTTEVTVDRRAKNREEKLTPEEAAQSGIANKEGSEAGKAESTADDVISVESDRFARQIQEVADAADEEALRLYVQENADAIAKDLADGNYGAVFDAMANLPRKASDAEAGRLDIGALLSGVRNIAKSITGPGKVAAIKNFMQSFFGKSPALAAKKTNPFRSAAEWSVSMGREEIVTRTPEGPAKRMAEDLQALGDVATAKSHEFVQRDGLIGDYSDALDASSALSTSQVKEMTAPTGTMGAADANWRGRYRAAAPKDAEEGKFFSALYKVIAKAWDNARAMGFLKDGKPLPQRGTAPYLPTMYSEPMLRALSEAGVGDWLKSVIKATQAKYAGKIKPDVVEKIILGWKEAFSGDVSVRTAAERKHAIEFDRVIELPDYVDGIPTQVLNPQEYLVRYAKAISNRVGFESAMRGKDLKDLRGQFVTQGGDGRLFDAWADQAQGQWKNYNELVEGNEATGYVGKVANEAIQWAKTMKLTGSSIPNATSLIYGPLHQTYGWANTMKAVAQETALELGRFVRNLKAWGGSKAGRAMTRDFARSLQEANAFEKYQPHVTGSIFDTLINVSRRARFALSRFTYRHINRLSDRVSARAMSNFLDDLAKLKANGKPMPTRRIERLTMYLGLTKDQASSLLSGKATEAEKAFLSELSSQVFFGAARSPQSLSRAQKNPLIRMGIWFASHATKQARLLVRSYDQTVRDWKASAGQPFWKRGALTGISAGRNIGGNLAAQAIAGTANLIAIAATHGDFVWEGDDSATWKSMTERPGQFAQNALLAAGVFGPLASTASRFSGQETVGEMLTKFISPVEIATNAKHWAMGTGPYQDQGSLLDRTLYGLTRRTPGPRIVSTLMAVAGLTARNVDTDNGIRAHYQYLRDQGQGFGGPRKPVPEEHAAMRAELKDALQTMVDGGDPTGLILKAIKAKGDDVRKVAASIRGMKLVDKIAPEEMGAYRRYMGDKQYEALLRRDALLEVWAQAILKAGGEGVPKTDAAKQKQLARVDARLPAMIDADEAFAKAAGIAKQVQEIAKAKQALRRGAPAEAIGAARALTGKRAENKLMGFDAQLIEGTRKRLKKRAENQ